MVKPRSVRLSNAHCTALRDWLAAALGVAVTLGPGLPSDAREIQRGSNSSATAAANAAAAATKLVMQTAPTIQRAQAALARTTQALQSIQAAQAAANAAANASNAANLVNSQGQTLPSVPNGLVAPTVSSIGGLDPDSGVTNGVANPVVTWVNADTPTQKISANGTTTVTITQTAQDALLNWTSFNVGKNTIVDFNQSAGGSDVDNWIAFNKINDPSVNPSQILGQIDAKGQVYLINQNGIIFGGSSQVNVHALVASGLAINNNLVADGLLNNPDSQFLFSSLPVAAGASTAAFTPTFTDPIFTASALTNGNSYTFQQAASSKPDVTVDYYSVGTSGVTSVTLPSTDYTVAGNKITFNSAGLAAIATGDGYISVSYATANTRAGDVTVNAGASLTSPADADGVGGKIALVGANVTNEGTISTPDGQTILAAGLQVGWVGHNSSDPTIRGLDVYIGAVTSTSGVANNSGTLLGTTLTDAGLINAPCGNVTLAGKTVNQDGIINSTTSVSLNGSIELLADYNSKVGQSAGSNCFYPEATGPVTLGQGSVTQILPDLSSAASTVGTTLALSSYVKIEGEDVYLAPKATILAPSGNVTLNAGDWGQFNPSGYPNNYTFVIDKGQVYLDSGALIDVAGSTDVQASVAQNFVSVQLLGTELADSPLQRNGPLDGQTVVVDLLNTGSYDGQEWAGTSLGDTTGYINLIQRTVGELTTNGGAVTINAGGTVVMQAGSTIDVSGGWINYQGAYVQTTQLISDGHLYDISQATPDLVYDGIYNGLTTTDSKWGVTNTYNSAVLDGAYYAPGYIQGGSGGSLTITAPFMELDGALHGNTVAGPHQRTALSSVAFAFADTTIAPTMEWLLGTPNSSSISLVFANEIEENGGWTQWLGSSTPPVNSSPTPANIVFQNGSNLSVPSFSQTAAVSATVFTTPNDEVDLSPKLMSSDGFGTLTIDNSAGSIKVAAALSIPGNCSHVQLNADGVVQNDSSGNPIELSGGSLIFNAANIDIEAPVTAPGGELSFTVYDYSKFWNIENTQTATPAPASNNADGWAYGSFTLGSGVSLDTAGLIVDDRTGGSAPQITNGGSVTISGYQVDLQAQSTIDASAGAYITSSGKVTYGKGGSINIAGGKDPLFASIGQLNGVSSGYLDLGATLEGYGSGSSLTILAPLVQIGGGKGENGDISGDTLLLGPSFFSQGGFCNFSISGIGAEEKGTEIPALLVAANTKVLPVVTGWTLDENAAGDAVLEPMALALGVRTAVNLTLSAQDIYDSFNYKLLIRGSVVLGTGSLIETDPQTVSTRGVTVQGQTVAVLGTIDAPGGTIAITGANSYPLLDAPAGSIGNAPQVTVDLGPNSVLSTAGTTLLTPDLTGHGYLTGSVLPGGTIKVSGNIAAETGATLNVSGASGVLDLLPSYSGVSDSASGNLPVPTRVDSNGGSITLAGGQELFSNATLLGAGGETAQGGSLTVSCGTFIPPGSAIFQNPTLVTMVVTQGGATTFPELSAGQTLIGSALQGIATDQAGGAVIYGHFAGCDPVYGDNTQGMDLDGFASLTLQGTLDFQGTGNSQSGVLISAARSLTIATGNGYTGGVIYSNGPVTLDAPYVDLGMPFAVSGQQTDPFEESNAPYNFSPVYGTATLTVNASTLIDIGSLSLQNIGTASFTTSGDIRGDGTLDVAGMINMTAGQIYPPTEVSFTIAAYNYSGGSGSVNIQRDNGSVSQTPLSAGGTLNIFASTIVQDGALRAPIGTINLGWKNTDSEQVDVITGNPFDSTQSLTLGKGSLTSVSAIDSATGKGLVIPYGTIENGTEWIDPSGTDITAGGAPSKAINLSANNVSDASGSILDISGGGNLYAYQWVSGIGGTNDILSNTTKSFAIVPGNQSAYAPDDYATYENSSLNTGGAEVGEQVYLQASNGLPAGYYTLLPARYALLPGAFLVTPESSVPIPGSAVLQADGSSLVLGYQFNGLASAGQQLYSTFEVDPQSVVRARAEYDNFYANSFLAKSAASNNVAVPRLPVDAGQVVFNATQSLTLNGSLIATPAPGGLGGMVDISSSSEILIGDSQTTAEAGVLVLDSNQLTDFGAASLLIGGYRQTGANGTSVVVTANNLAVNNGGTGDVEPLSGPDVILVSNQKLTVDDGSVIESTGKLSGLAGTLAIDDSDSLSSGNSLSFERGGIPIVFPVAVAKGQISSNVGGTITEPDGTTVSFASGALPALSAGSSVTLDTPASGVATLASTSATSIPVTLGDGALLRVSSDSNAQITRSGVALLTGGVVKLTIGAATITGASVTLDSSDLATLDPNTQFTNSTTAKGGTLSLDAGTVNINLASSDITMQSPGLTLTQSAIDHLQAAGLETLSLLSYTSIDIYGTTSLGSPIGGASLQNLALHAAEIRGFDTGGGTVAFEAQNITLDNSPGGTSPGATTTNLAGTLSFNGETIQVGANQLSIDQYSTVELNASNVNTKTNVDSGRILVQDSGGLSTQGDLTLTTPLLTGATGASQTISANGALEIQTTGAYSNGAAAGGLGASLTLQGASVEENGEIVLPSGSIKLESTGAAATDDVTVAGTLDAGGMVQQFFDVAKYTDAGKISLISNYGDVDLQANSIVNVSRCTLDNTTLSWGGNAGTLSISAELGTLKLDSNAQLLGQGGKVLNSDGSVAVQGQNGTFSLDVNTINGAVGGNLTSLETLLNTGVFTQSQSIRVRTGDVFVEGNTAATQVNAFTFNLSTDSGSIWVDGEINASGAVGGTVDLEAYGSVTLSAGSLVTVEGAGFNSAGQGGSVSLEAGCYEAAEGTYVDPQSGITMGNLNANAYVNIAKGATVNLTVKADTTGGVFDSTKAEANELLGDYSGTLHLRAPQTTDGTDVQIKEIDGTITGASSIMAEGFKVYIPAGGVIDTIENQIYTDGNTFATTNAPTITGRLLANNSSLAPVFNLSPGAEIDGIVSASNPTGSLTLQTDWDLSTFRFGTQEQTVDAYGNPTGVWVGVEPGILTLRAAGSITFDGSLSDGFGDSTGVIPTDPATGDSMLWTENLLPLLYNSSTQTFQSQLSWSYRITAGADFTAANFRKVVPAAQLPKGSGCVYLGQNDPNPQASTISGAIETSNNSDYSYYQVIRTGAGSIDISAAADVDLLNQFATIYTAGTLTPDPTLGGAFSTPNLYLKYSAMSGGEDAAYAAQYSQDGGNVTIAAQGNIQHLTQNINGQLVADSEAELPDNWLYRRGSVSGDQFATTIFGDKASTTWWIDFSNFFEGVGALGGGNVTMAAGNSINNVDAVIPTNGRVTYQIVTGNTTDTAPADQQLVELGGGNLLVQAGENINGGVYYVENGQGTLSAGNAITTNVTRAADPQESTSEQSWLPTTLFVGGNSGFTVSAVSDVLLGPVANVFLLPQGIDNTFYDKTYFSTYGSDASLNVSSLAGSVTFREDTTIQQGETSLLDLWLSNILLKGSYNGYSQPWLLLDETTVTGFSTVASVMPGTLDATAFSGDLNIDGNITLSPSPVGTIDFVAAGSINGLQPDGAGSNGLANNNTVTYWAPATIDLSDANPASIPGVRTPLGYESIVAEEGGNVSYYNTTSTAINFLAPIDNLFDETGATQGAETVLQVQQALHGSSLLHADDPNPVHLFAENGDISGLTLYSAKFSQVIAGQDITDIALYIQNVNANDISIVSAGRDIVLYDPTSSLRDSAIASGNEIDGSTENITTGTITPPDSEPGDILIGGPGTLEVLAGQNLTLGTGVRNSTTDALKATDGTGIGIASIGKESNPNLPSEGASVIASAGVDAASGDSTGLSDSPLNFARFISDFDTARYLSDLNAGFDLDISSFASLTVDQRDIDALDLFFIVLRDAGRDHNNSSSTGYGNYNSGYAAIKALFSSNGNHRGDISLSSRSIETEKGGNISLLAPGGQITLGSIVSADGAPPGVITEFGGDISIVAQNDVNIGVERIFTLRGGNEIIWSSEGNIAAGNSSKTVQTASPTGVLIDPQSADVQVNPAGLATGGGIGVLEMVAGVPPANVDLIAPVGSINAGQAGIRVSGNLNISAATIVNAGNIQVAGASSGVPAVSAPSLGGLSLASANTSGAATSAADQVAGQSQKQQQQEEDIPSIITVEVLGYGGGDGGDGSDDGSLPEKKKS